MLFHPVGPIVDQHSKILILGSMPGKVSLEKQQYYAHPQNRFWPIMFTLFNHPFTEDYTERIRFIKEHKIALWDSIYSCEREGSLDKTIKNETPNDIPGLLQKFPDIVQIICNGQKSYSVFQKNFGKALSIGVMALPSTSPIPRKTIRNLDDLLSHWQIVLKLLDK